MSEAQRQVLENIKKFAPVDFGVKKAYYRATENGVEVIFFVDKEKAGSLISYLNSLSTLIQKEVKSIKVDSSVYVDEKDKDIDTVVKKEKMEKIDLLTMNLAGACA